MSVNDELGPSKGELLVDAFSEAHRPGATQEEYNETRAALLLYIGRQERRVVQLLIELVRGEPRDEW